MPPQPPSRKPSPPARWSKAERVIQANIALAVCQAGMLRITLELPPNVDDRPDPLLLVLFLLLGAGAIASIVWCRRSIAPLSPSAVKFAATIGTIVFQFAVFQALFTYTSASL